MSVDDRNESASIVMWRLLPTDVAFSTVYVLQLRRPAQEDLGFFRDLGWTVAALDVPGEERYLLATTDLDVALSSGFSESAWLDSRVITV